MCTRVSGTRKGIGRIIEGIAIRALFVERRVRIVVVEVVRALLHVEHQLAQASSPERTGGDGGASEEAHIPDRTPSLERPPREGVGH